VDTPAEAQSMQKGGIDMHSLVYYVTSTPSYEAHWGAAAAAPQAIRAERAPATSRRRRRSLRWALRPAIV
jgi:hypothetical protein